MPNFFRQKFQNNDPIIDLIQYYYDYHPKESDFVNSFPNELKILNGICDDRADISKIRKYTDTGKILSKFFPKLSFSLELLLQLHSFYGKKNNIQDSFALIVCFQCYKYLNNDKCKTTILETEYIGIMSCLLKINSTNAIIRKNANIITGELIQGAIDIKEFKWEISEISLMTLDFFHFNYTLDSLYFPLMISFLKKIILLNDQNLTLGMLSALSDLDNANAPILQVDDYNSLILLIYPFIQKMDNIAVRIFGKFTCRAPKESLYEYYINMSTNLFEMIKNSETQIIFQEKKYTLPDLPANCSMSGSGYKFSNSQTKYYSLSYCNLFLNVIPLKKLINDSILFTIQSVLSCFSFIQETRGEYTPAFLLSFVQLLKANVCNNIQAFSVFFYILNNYKNKNFIEDNINLFKDTIVFDPFFNIFQTSDFNIYLNTIRDSFINYIIDLSPNLIIRLLETIEDNVFIFAEYLLRIYEKSDHFDLSIFNSNKFISSCINNTMRINILSKQDNSKLVERTKNSLFYFLSQLLLRKETFRFAFSSNNFITGYFTFLFENTFSSPFLNVIENSLSCYQSIDGINYDIFVKIIKKIINICIVNSKDSNYQNLFKDLVSCLYTLTKYTTKLCSYFEQFIIPIIKFEIDFPDKSILNSLFGILPLISANTESFEFDEFLLCKLYKCIKLCYQNEPPLNICKNMFCILKKNANFIDKSLFLISIPSILPLIIASYGKSTRIKSILKIIYNLCNYSFSNIRACCSGGLDLILLQYIFNNGKEPIIKYRNLEFHLCLDLDILETIVIPLLSILIANNPTNISIHYLLSN